MTLRSTLRATRPKPALAAVFTTLIATLATGSAHASAITEDYNFSLSGFTDIAAGTTPPIGQVSGSFAVTFDPTQNYTNDTADLVVNSFNGVTVDSPLAFSYDASNQHFSFGGSLFGTGDALAGLNDFTLNLLLSNPSAPQFALCSTNGFTCEFDTGNSSIVASGYTQTGTQSTFFASAADSSVSAAPNATPLPAGLPLFATGLGTLGLLGWRRKRKAPASLLAS